MADRFQKLFSLENNLYIENAPIIISAAALLKDTKSGNIVVQVKFKSVSNKNIKGVKISLSAYDISGKEINGVDDYQYLDLNIPNGLSFGSSKAIVMSETTTRSFTIKSITVIFADSSIWGNASPDFVVIPNAKTLNCELENEELVKQYKIATTKKANYIPNTFLNLWTCCCGEVNSEEYCSNCGTNKNDAFSKYDITDLTEAVNLRLDKEREKQLELERQAEIERIANTKKKRKIKTIIAIAMPIFAVLIAFIIVLNMVIIPNNQLATAKQLINNERYAEAYEILIGTKSNVSNSETINETKYFLAQKLLDNGDILKGQMMLVSLRNYKDSQNILRKYNYTGCNFLDSDLFHNIALKSDGTLLANNIPDKDDDEGQCNIENWKDIIAISTSFYHTVGLKKDGTVIAVGTNKYGQCSVGSWRDIVAISAGSRHTVGLKSDGTVVSTQITDSEIDAGQTKIEEWEKIKAIAVGDYFTAGLKSDGTVVTAGKYMPSPPWTDIVAITAGDYHLVGLKSDGTVVATASNIDEKCSVGDWKNIVAISAGYDFTVGLRADGTVITTEVTLDDHNCGKTNVGNWKNIVAISAGGRHTAGVKADGTVIAIGSNENNNCEVSEWNVFK